MFVFINKVFIKLLSFNKSLVNMVNVSLNKQQCISRLTLINIDPDDCNQRLC